MFGIGIASVTYDSAGNVFLLPLPDGTNIRGNARRLSRTKTLDGGVVFTDGGVRVGDRTIEISVSSTAELWTLIFHLFEVATWVTVATEEGCFLAKFSECREADGKIKITALVSSDLSK